MKTRSIIFNINAALTLLAISVLLISKPADATSASSTASSSSSASSGTAQAQASAQSGPAGATSFASSDSDSLSTEAVIAPTPLTPDETDYIEPIAPDLTYRENDGKNPNVCSTATIDTADTLPIEINGMLNNINSQLENHKSKLELIEARQVKTLNLFIVNFIILGIVIALEIILLLKTTRQF